MVPVGGERSCRRVGLVIRGRRVRELVIGVAALRLASQGQADESETQRLEGQPPARRNLSSLTVSGRLTAEEVPSWAGQVPYVRVPDRTSLTICCRNAQAQPHTTGAVSLSNCPAGLARDFHRGTREPPRVVS